LKYYVPLYLMNHPIDFFFMSGLIGWHNFWMSVI
jgi:hypothetical protein